LNRAFRRARPITLSSALPSAREGISISRINGAVAGGCSGLRHVALALTAQHPAAAAAAAAAAAEAGGSGGGGARGGGRLWRAHSAL
jgi:hypothetical protein